MAETRLSGLVADGRIVWLDVLRGAALFGIAQINFPSFAAAQLPVSSLYSSHASGWQQLLYGAITLFVTAKFYPVFAFLFGYGHALQRERLASRGLNARATLLRRYGALLLFGIFHGSLLFFGDILTMYAIGGLLLLAESGRDRPRSHTALLRWTLVSVVMTALFCLFLPSFPDSIHADWVRMHADDLAVLRTHDWRLIVQARAELYLSSQFEDVVSFLPELMLFMYAGIWASEHGVLQQPALHRPLFKRCLMMGLLVGLPINLVLMLCELDILNERVAPVALGSLLDNLAFLMSLGWLGLLGLYAASHPGTLPRPVAWLAALGRVALTNYVVQSLVMMGLWYLAWQQITAFGAPEAMAMLAAIVCLIQLCWAQLQVRSGRQGPLEAAWRRITYGIR